ncbi:MAG: TVP38/TMEM64 family protein [Baekduia sp.]
MNDSVDELEELAADTVAGVGRRAALLRVATLVTLVGGLFAVLLLSGDVSAERVRDWVDGFGKAAPIAFFFTSALLTVCFFPGPFLAISAGLLFGTAGGFPLAMISALAGACAAFLLSRTIAHDAVERLQGPRLQRLRIWVSERGFVSVLAARLMPGIPYNSVNYAAGLTSIPIGVFGAATALGAAPRTWAYVTVGGSWGNWTSPEMFVAYVMLVAVAIAGVVLARSQRPPQ